MPRQEDIWIAFVEDDGIVKDIYYEPHPDNVDYYKDKIRKYESKIRSNSLLSWYYKDQLEKYQFKSSPRYAKANPITCRSLRAPKGLLNEKASYDTDLQSTSSSDTRSESSKSSHF